MNTDLDWEKWGTQDPYFSVLTNPKFRSAVLGEAAREEFFASGRWHVEYVLATCRKYFAPAFSPDRTLDFGCGVGRLVIPFASVSREVVGVDVSPSMLSEAQRNCQASNTTNVAFIRSDDRLSLVDGQFDLVHSCIVLQHIEIPRGRILFKHLVERIRPGGLGALHVTFAWDAFPATYGQPPSAPPTPEPTEPAQPISAGPIASLLSTLGLKSRTDSDDAAATAAPPVAAEPPGDPVMQMNYYNLSELTFILQRAGVQRLYSDITDHGGAIGAFLFFQKPD